jgi:vitamin B12/bleomycin/antimicrobial peptide transport system ATP-binding/permease protein
LLPLVIAVLQLVIQYRLNYWNRDFFNALARRDGDTLWRQVTVFAPLAIISVGLSGLTAFLYRRMRDYCIDMISSRWLAKGANVCGAGGR